MSAGTGFGGGNFGLSAQPTGFPNTTGSSSLGVGLRPQVGGAGVANPFRASMMTPGPGAGSFPGPFGASSNASAGVGLFSQPTGAPAAFGQGLFGGADASKRQNGAASLI